MGRCYYDIEGNENICKQLKEAGIYDDIMSWKFKVPYIEYFDDNGNKSNMYNKTIKAHASIEDIAVLGSGANGYIKLHYLDRIKESVMIQRENLAKREAEKEVQE